MKVFGYPVLEAFVSGTLVVGSDAIPPELFVNSFNGFRVHGFEAKVYVNTILKLLRNDMLWRLRMGTMHNYSP